MTNQFSTKRSKQFNDKRSETGPFVIGKMISDKRAKRQLFLKVNSAGISGNPQQKDHFRLFT